MSKAVLSTFADSGASAAGSFLAGLLALSAYNDSELAVYALLFSAGVAAMVLPQHFALLPRRMHINKLKEVRRGRYRADALASLPYFAVAVAFVSVSAIPIAHTVPSSTSGTLVIGAVLWIVCSSFQDHVRTSLHVTGHHHFAALVSVAQLLVCTVGFVLNLVIGDHFPTPLLLVFPFAVLVVANLVSAGLGVALHSRVQSIAVSPSISFQESVLTGTSGLLLQLFAYATNLLIAIGLGSEALASLETARIAAQPVLIAATALATLFMPRVIRLRHTGRTYDASRQLRKMIGIQLGAGVIYAAAMPWLGAALTEAAGRAVDVGLSAARVVSSAAQAAVNPLNQLNIASRQFGRAVVSTLVSSVVGLLALLLLMPPIDAYALPAAVAIAAITRAALLYLAEFGRPGKQDSSLSQ